MTALWETYPHSLWAYPVVIDAPGDYSTRDGNKVTIQVVSTDNVHRCRGFYHDCGIADHWHKSGRISSMTESTNDIVRKAE